MVSYPHGYDKIVGGSNFGSKQDWELANLWTISIFMSGIFQMAGIINIHQLWYSLWTVPMYSPNSITFYKLFIRTVRIILESTIRAHHTDVWISLLMKTHLFLMKHRIFSQFRSFWIPQSDAQHSSVLERNGFHGTFITSCFFLLITIWIILKMGNVTQQAKGELSMLSG